MLSRKRSVSVTFYKEYFSRLPGYPQLDGNGDLLLAIYSMIPGTGVLSGTQLQQTVTAASTQIQSSLGKRLCDVIYIYMYIICEMKAVSGQF